MSRLALLGGDRTVPEGMMGPWPVVTEADRQAVLRALDDPDGERVENESLAREFAEYLGVRYCIPTNSGTAALHMCVAAVRAQPGDEVICPAFTYWATAAAVLHHNVIPVFVDIEPETFNMDPAQVEGAISERTKAILAVHIHGMPADMDPIIEIARRHDLAVIEDCAQAAGAVYRGRKVGTLGDCAGFSLQASKPLSSGSQGGLFVTDDEQLWRMAGLLQYLGELVVPGRERETQAYNAYGLGWMYRGHKLGLAFTRSQLPRLEEYNAVRRANAERLDAGLARIPGVRTAACPGDRVSAGFEFVVEFRPQDVGLDVPVGVFREAMQAALRAEGVPTHRWQTLPVPAQAIFQVREGYGRGCPWVCHGSTVTYDATGYPVTQRFIDGRAYVAGVRPPNGSDLMDLYAQAFRKVLAEPAAVVDACRPAEAKA